MQNSDKDEIIQEINKVTKIIGNITQVVEVRFGKLENKIDQIQLKEIPAIRNELQETNKNVQKLDKELQETNQEVKCIRKDLEKTNSEVKCIRKDLEETNNEVRKISKSVAVIEHEHGDKIKVLFDAFGTNSQRILDYDEVVKKLNKLFKNHDDRIYLLESKVQGR